MKDKNQKSQVTSVAKRAFHVLIVDDDLSDLELFQHQLTLHDFQVTTAQSAEDCLEQIKNKTPDLILLDILMPETSGLELLHILRQDEKTATIPVILISGLGDTDDIVKGLEKGANDYITKPINLPILLARMHTQLRMGQLLKRLKTQTKILSRLAALDELTGIYNRRSMYDVLQTEFQRHLRYGHPLSILMMDIDHFKGVNDGYGHAAGDEVLRDFVDTVSKLLRSNDMLSRYGGEEFCAVLPESDEQSAEKVAERIRKTIQDSDFPVRDTQVSITVSIGIATLKPGMEKDVRWLLETADKALYRAKQRGRNCVASHPGD